MAYLTLSLVWLAIFVSQVLFVVIVYFVKPDIFAPGTSRSNVNQTPEIVLGLAALAIVLLISSFAVKYFLMREAVKSQSIAMVFVSTIVGCSLCEAVSLFGVLAAFVADYPYFFAFSIGGIVGTFLHCPRRSDVYAASFKPGL